MATHEERQKALAVLREASHWYVEHHGIVVTNDERDIALACLKDCIAIPREEWEKLVAQSRRFYNADGSFTEMEPEYVVEKRKEAARQMDSYRRGLWELMLQSGYVGPSSQLLRRSNYYDAAAETLVTLGFVHCDRVARIYSWTPAAHEFAKEMTP